MAHANDDTRAYTLGAGNRIDASSSPEGQPGGPAFKSEQELAQLAAGWPVTQLIEIWNQLPGVRPVRKFTDRNTAVRRIWKAIQLISFTEPPRAPTEAAGEAKMPRAADTTKAACVIALLRQPSGATLDELMAATGWQAHSVRGFISGQLSKKRRMKIKSFTRDGVRVYRIRR